MDSMDDEVRDHLSGVLKGALEAIYGVAGYTLTVLEQYLLSWSYAKGHDRASRLILSAYRHAIHYLVGSA